MHISRTPTFVLALIDALLTPLRRSAYTPAAGDVIVTDDRRTVLLLNVTPSPYPNDATDYVYVLGLNDDAALGTFTDHVPFGAIHPATLIQEAVFWKRVTDSPAVDAFTAEYEKRAAKSALADFTAL